MQTLRDTLDPFTRAYIECALWSSSDEGGEPFDSRFDIDDISADSLDKIIDDCRTFQAENAGMLAAAYDGRRYDEGAAGHDFWLTRNHHGVGFWDRGMPEALGTALSAAATAYGDQYVCEGDDGQIYFEGGL
jgi:hypothetical protein